MNHISDYKNQEEKSNSSDSDSYADNIEDSGGNEDEEFSTEKQKVRKQESFEDTRRKLKGHDTSIKDKIGNVNLINKNDDTDKDPEFQSLAVTNKHMIIGTKGGYLLIFERSQKNSIKHLGKVKLSDRYVSIRSLTLNSKEDVLAITAICPYQIEELESLEGENLDQVMKFNPPDLKNKDKGKAPYTFLFNHKKTTNTKVEYKYKERIELLYVGIKSLTTSLTHASFK